MKTIAILILAAGASSRMRGKDKLMETVNGQPLLEHITTEALATLCPTYVVVPDAAQARQDVIRETAAHLVGILNHNPSLSKSLCHGINALKDQHDAAMILLADMPEIDRHDLNKMIHTAQTAPDDTILRAETTDGAPGHPVLFPRRYFTALTTLTGDKGAGALLRQMADQVQRVPLPGQHAVTDLDTPEDWAAWRSRGH